MEATTGAGAGTTTLTGALTGAAAAVFAATLGCCFAGAGALNFDAWVGFPFTTGAGTGTGAGTVACGSNGFGTIFLGFFTSPPGAAPSLQSQGKLRLLHSFTLKLLVIFGKKQNFTP